MPGVESRHQAPAPHRGHPLGINRFSLYATFNNKHDLFMEALEAYYDLVAVILKGYLQLVEADFRAAIERARDLGEIPPSVDAGKHAKVLTTYSTGLLSVAKVLTEREAAESVRAMVASIR